MGAVNAYRAEHASSGGVAHRTPLDEAVAGLKRSTEEVARLERASAR
jgi:hypothetical protein